MNSQARLNAGARGRIRLKAIIAQTPCTLHHGVPGKEAGILWGGHITLLFSDSLEWHTGQLWSCLKATQPKDFSLQPSLIRRLHADQLYFFSADFSHTDWLQRSPFAWFHFLERALLEFYILNVSSLIFTVANVNFHELYWIDHQFITVSLLSKHCMLLLSPE